MLIFISKLSKITGLGFLRSGRADLDGAIRENPKDIIFVVGETTLENGLFWC